MMQDQLTIEDLREVNIFYIDHDPVAAARAHCDRHVVKMIVETAQLLSTAWHMAAPKLLRTDIGESDPAFSALDASAHARKIEARLPFGTTHYLAGQRIYGKTHEAHPSALWVRESRAAYAWAWTLGMALLDEYTFRYGRVHATTPVLRTLEAVPPTLRDRELEEPPLAMAPEFWRADAANPRLADALASYRAYYRDGKRHLLTYTRRAPPDWVADVAKFKEGRRDG